jgi:hypothetical protein
MSEMKSFIKTLVVNAYNSQRSKTMLSSDFDVKAIQKNQNSDCAFEVFTQREDDWLRLRIYATFSSVNLIGPFRVEEEEDIAHTGSGDEVLVADAFLDKEFFYNDNNYIRRLVEVEGMNIGDALLLESGEPFLLEDGTTLLVESAN